MKDDIFSEYQIQLISIHKVIITKDNGLLIAGEYDSKITFIKTDENFRIIWRKDYYTMDLWVGKVINIYDGSYALTSWNFNDESFIKVLNSDGDELKSKKYSFSEIPFNETGNDLIQNQSHAWHKSGN